MANSFIQLPLSTITAPTTSAQLASAITDETGTGALVFGTSPTFTTDLTTPKVLGSVAASGTLTLQSTSNATKGKLLFGASAYDEVNNRLGIGIVTPTSTLEVNGDIRLTGSGGVNRTIQFGSNYGVAALNLYGTSWGWGLNAGEMQFFGTGNGTDHISFNAGGALNAIGANEVMRIALAPGNVGIGIQTPTAKLHLKAGTTAASTAPLKLTSGALMTTAEAGAVEFLTDDLYATITTGAARKKLVLSEISGAARMPQSGAALVTGNAVLVAGTVTVSTTAATTNAKILLTRKTSGGTIGTGITYTINAGVSFTITSDSALDTSTFTYLIIEGY